MTRARIQTRVWLSIGIFVLGFLLTIIVSQVERKRAERGLAGIAEAVLPAAQAGRDAEDAFQRVEKAYGEVFVMEDRSGLDRAAAEGSRALEALERIGATREASADHTAMAWRVALTLRRFLGHRNLWEYPSGKRSADAGIPATDSRPGAAHGHPQGRP
jgi:hypothetical protein